MQNQGYANLEVFDGLMATANAAIGSELGVFNDQPSAQRRSIGQRIADTASAANDWMGRNVGVAVPSGREVATAYGDTVTAVGEGVDRYGRAIGREAKAIGQDAYTGAQAGRDIVKASDDPLYSYNPLAHLAGALVGGGSKAISGFVDRGIRRVFPKTSDDVSE